MDVEQVFDEVTRYLALHVDKPDFSFPLTVL